MDTSSCKSSDVQDECVILTAEILSDPVSLTIFIRFSAGKVPLSVSERG